MDRILLSRRQVTLVDWAPVSVSGALCRTKIALADDFGSICGLSYRCVPAHGTKHQDKEAIRQVKIFLHTKTRARRKALSYFGRWFLTRNLYGYSLAHSGLLKNSTYGMIELNPLTWTKTYRTLETITQSQFVDSYRGRGFPAGRFPTGQNIKITQHCCKRTRR